MSAESVALALDALNAGRPVDAIAVLRQAPDTADDPIALQAWSVALTRLGGDPAAPALLERAVRLAPGDAQAHFNLGVAAEAAGALEAAVMRYGQALALDPNHLGALNNLSDLLRRRGRPEEGWELMQRYLSGGGGAAGQELRLAKLALDTRRYADALAWFRKAAAATPDDPRVTFEHSMLTLLLEDFAEGFAQYEARLPVYGHAGLAIHDYGLPAWSGEAKPGLRLLLHREQGLGDMMMFAAAVPGLLEAGVQVNLAQAPSLTRLFAESFPKARVWPSVTVAGPAPPQPQPFLAVCGPLDGQAPMGSLGALAMRHGPPAPVAYLKPPPHEVARWKARLEALAPPRRGERRVGLVGGARLPRFSDDGLSNGLRKSVPPAELEPLADVGAVRWFALHDRSNAEMLADIPRLPLVDLSPFITDFADTAAAIANLDLVITVDTAVAHLAGAMGKPTWVLLWRNADWRWGVERADSLWYPAVRTFRQARAHRWGPVIEDVARALG